MSFETLELCDTDDLSDISCQTLNDNDYDYDADDADDDDRDDDDNHDDGDDEYNWAPHTLVCPLGTCANPSCTYCPPSLSWSWSWSSLLLSSYDMFVAH